MTSKRCALYRHFDADDLLLYLGISDNPVQRGKDHARDSDWVQYAVRAEVTWHSSRAEALAAEAAAIVAERPLFNQQHNDTVEARATRARYLAVACSPAGSSTIYFDVDGDAWWRRRIHIDIFDGGAGLVLDRDSYVDFHHEHDGAPWKLARMRAIDECSVIGLNCLWSLGHWIDTNCDHYVNHRYAKLNVPAGMVRGAVNALTEIELTGSRKKLDLLSAAMADLTNHGELVRLRVPLNIGPRLIPIHD